jgi:hypothetical protein
VDRFVWHSQNWHRRVDILPKSPYNT